jgi:hypothetical protein
VRTPDAFRRSLDEPDAHLHVTGFTDRSVVLVLTRDGLEARRRAEVWVRALGGQQPFTHGFTEAVRASVRRVAMAVRFAAVIAPVTRTQSSVRRVSPSRGLG